MGHCSSTTGPPPGALRAGDRAPDAPCHDATGVPIRIFDVLRGPHWTLLAFDRPDVTAPESVRVCPGLRPDAPGSPRAIVDTDGHAQRAFDPKTLYLVRPDGYIGCATTDAATLTGYLRGVLPG